MASPVIFVPTMGSLHDGHSQLIKAASNIKTNIPGEVLVSIFVNPLQFGPNEDFEDYPRDLQKDYDIAKLSGVTALWAPSKEEVFPKGNSYKWNLKAPPHLTKHLCGPRRKGHFDGVVSVMTRLLTLICPDFLVLGEKDWQQLIILRELIKELRLPIKVRSVATVRDDQGLALSSRNQFLNRYQRTQAHAISYLLGLAREKAHLGIEIDLNKLHLDLEKKGLQVEYIETVDPFSLQPIKPGREICLLATAVHCGKTRLIDHTFLMNRKPIIAIDGPAGAGKSTVTQALAKKLGLIYLDTGAMYRAVTWLIQSREINPEDISEISKALKSLDLVLECSNSGEQSVRINGQDVTKKIRSPKVTAMVSKIATNEAVRQALTTQQQKMGTNGGLVAEGRDIGTAVFPDADVKIFLTATPLERANRRALDLRNQGYKVPDIKEIECQIKERDYIDSTRSISPLVKAQDATELITDGMSIEEVVEALLELFRLKVPEEVWPIYQE